VSYREETERPLEEACAEGQRASLELKRLCAEVR